MLNGTVVTVVVAPLPASGSSAPGSSAGGGGGVSSKPASRKKPSCSRSWRASSVDQQANLPAGGVLREYRACVWASQLSATISSGTGSTAVTGWSNGLYSAWQRATPVTPSWRHSIPSARGGPTAILASTSTWISAGLLPAFAGSSGSES